MEWLRKTKGRLCGVKRRKHLIGCLMAGILAFSGCGTGGAQDAEAQNPEQEQDTAAQMDAFEIYRPILDKYYQFLSDGTELQAEMDGMTGIMDVMSSSYGENVYENIGYCILDVSGDGVEELLIGLPSDIQDEDYKYGILACYTIVAGEPQLVFEGWYRDMYWLIEPEQVYNRGSAGAAYSIIQTYRFSEDGTKLQPVEMYFTEPKEASYDLDDMSYYYNTTGEWDSAVSEEITENDYIQMEREWDAQILFMDFMPFSEYTPVSVPAVKQNTRVLAAYADDILVNYADYDTFDTEDGAHEEQVKVAFVGKGQVRDFKLLSLTLDDVTEDGAPIYGITEIFAAEQLPANHPLFVDMTFMGSIPNYGISYLDQDGVMRYFAVEMSGNDGSILLTEF